MKLHDHDPDIFEVAQLPVKYDPKATCPEFDKYLDTTLEPEIHPLVEELFGYALIADTRFEKAAMLTGGGSNGKGVFLDTLTALLGSENVSSVALQDLEEQRFKAAELYGKLANIFADLDVRAMQSSTMFKTIVTGDEITAERKFQQPFKFRPYARMFYSCNELPESRDVTYAFYRRWLIIPFARTFEKGKDADLSLRDKLTGPEELSGILNRALQGLQRLFEQGYFTEPAEVQDALKQYQRQNDTVTAFIEEQCTLGPTESITKQAFYLAYKTWCMDQGLKFESQKRLKYALERAVPHLDEYRPTNRAPWEWVGIAVRG
jgi:putative DNA primase/helicase